MTPTAIKAWLGQATTGAGIAAIFGTLSAVASGTMTWHGAGPVLVAAVVGLIWPENKAAQKDANTLASDLIAFVPLISAAVSHGQSNPPPPSVPVAPAPATAQ